MTINYRLVFPLLAIIILVSSCSSKFSVTKRRYMKGYHVDFAKKSLGTKTNKSSENTTENPVKIVSETKKTRVEINETYVNITQDPRSENRISKAKKTNVLSLNSTLKESKQNITTKIQALKLLIADHKQLENSFKTEASKADAPFDYFRSGGGTGFGTIILFSIIGLIISILVMVLIFALFSAALGGGGISIPAWVGGALIAIGIIVIIGVIVVVVINGD